MSNNTYNKICQFLKENQQKADEAAKTKKIEKPSDYSNFKNWSIENWRYFILEDL